MHVHQSLAGADASYARQEQASGRRERESQWRVAPDEIPTRDFDAKRMNVALFLRVHRALQGDCRHLEGTLREDEDFPLRLDTRFEHAILDSH